MKTLDHLRTRFTLVIDLEQINCCRWTPVLHPPIMNFIALLFESAIPVRLLLVNNEVYLMTYTQGSGAVYVTVV